MVKKSCATSNNDLHLITHPWRDLSPPWRDLSPPLEGPLSSAGALWEISAERNECRCKLDEQSTSLLLLHSPLPTKSPTEPLQRRAQGTLLQLRPQLQSSQRPVTKTVRWCRLYLTSTFCHLVDKHGFVATYEKYM